MRVFKLGVKLGTAALVALYIGDLMIARVRGEGAFGSVRVSVLYAIPEKAARMDFSAGPAQDVECVRALFPHFGDAPCWYASRQTTKRVDL
jgi:hypothetical protein